MKLEDLKIKIFADTASKENIIKYINEPFISGVTTNPSLLRKSGVIDYKQFIKDILPEIDKNKNISLEIISDDYDSMYKEAKILSNFGDNIYIKIPVINTKSELMTLLIYKLLNDGIKINITAVFTYKQLHEIAKAVNKITPTIVSIFSGRIANAGIDPEPICKYAKNLLQHYNNVEILWASVREIFNVIQAYRSNCDIVTVPVNILSQLNLLGKDLEEYSRETVEMFENDSKSSGLTIL